MDGEVVQTSRRRETWLAAAAIAAMVLAVYGDVLFRFDSTVISSETGDASLYFAPFRAFAAEELAKGNFPLWNPHVFSGSPFFGGFQSALLYPPNLMYMVLPLAFALNVDVCMHTFLLGLFMYVWVRPRVQRPESAIYAAALMMFGGPYALRVLAGQLTMLSSLAYAPLLLISIDRIFEGVAARRSVLGPVLVGILATSLQVVAGYPGTVFMMVVTAAGYCVLQFIGARRRFASIPPLLAVAVCPVAITLVQLWVGAETASESIRAGGGSFDFASSFSFPIRNLVTAVAPAYFGDNISITYWGKWNFWEVSLFIGLTGVVFCIGGLLWGRGRWRYVSAALAVLIMLIAFGRYTPVYGWLYDFVPGFDSFRAPSKFLFFAVLFLAQLAAAGLDAALTRARAARSIGVWIAGLLCAGLALGVAAVAWSVHGDPDTSPWGEMLYFAETNAEHYIWWPVVTKDVAATARLAEISLGIAACTALALALLLRMGGRSTANGARARVWVHIALVLGVLELVVFSRVYRREFDVHGLVRSEDVDRAYAACTAGERVLDIGRFDGRVRNYAVRVHGRAVWGYDPVILKRYGEFCSFAAGGWAGATELIGPMFLWGSDPFGDALNRGYATEGTEELGPGQKFLSLLRPKFIVRGPVPPEFRDFVSYITKSANFKHKDPDWDQQRAKEETVREVPVMFPEFFLATKYVIAPPTIESLQDMIINDVDFAQTVLLNDEPDPAPTPANLPAKFGVLDRSTDHFTIYVDVPADAILVATYAYSRGWRVVPEAGSAQSHYDVLPAYHALMAIPLKAGEHQFRLEYAPVGYRYGCWVSLACLAAYLSAVAYWFLRRRKTPSTVEPDMKDLGE